jgi:hypothetical protein
MATRDLPLMVGVRVVVPGDAGRPHPELVDTATGAVDALVARVVGGTLLPDPAQAAATTGSATRVTAHQRLRRDLPPRT